MKLLLDENLPFKLKYRFLEKGFKAYTVKDMGWLGKKNGELLELMVKNNFEIFVTIDNNLSHQQNFKNYPLGVAILIARDNTYETVMEFFDEIIGALNERITGTRFVVHPAYK